MGKGTGLGLSMVYGFAKQSGGHVHVDSTPDKGTRVCLYLPRSAGEAADDPVATDGALMRGSNAETILVVEDDDDVRAYTVEILREVGYRVIEASNGNVALQLLEQQKRSIHLLMTDVVMPTMSGRELASAARASLPDLKVLFTSGYPRDAIMRDGRLEPGVDLLAKPFTYLSLAAKVRELLEREAIPAA